MIKNKLNYTLLLSLGLLSSMLFSSCKKDKESCCAAAGSKADLISKGSDTSKSDRSELDLLQFSSNVKQEMVLIPSGTFMMGSNGDEWALPRELPQHPVKVDAFYMDVHEVTNAEFAKFVSDTGYITIAERPIDWEELKKQVPPGTPKPDPSVLEPSSMVFRAPSSISNYEDFSQWWTWVKGANWRQPQGPGSNLEGKEDFPVVQVAYYDAIAYAEWAGKRLPTEAEWEWAARGGLDNTTYPWGNEHVASGAPKLNYWTGVFPTENTVEDGFYGVAPIKSFDKNGYGLYDMSGNVWEMCSDWFDVDYYKTFDLKIVADNPKGPASSNYPQEPFSPKRVNRGGSYLCNDSYCSSYRVSARMPNSEDTSLNHMGFRCVKEIN